MNPFEFTHQVFESSSWEDEVKCYIDSLDCSDTDIWHRKRENKKINEELATLGYYVKYSFGNTNNISFKLNKNEGKIDGWIYENGKKIESIQIAIAFYEEEEAEIDRRTMKGEDIVDGGWVGNRISLLKKRIENRIIKKSNMGYQEIDTLLIGVRDWFVRRIKSKYTELKLKVIDSIKPSIEKSGFKQVVIVDTNFVGNGEHLTIPNKTTHPTSE